VVQPIIDQAEKGELDVTDAILKAYNQGKHDEAQTQKERIEVPAAPPKKGRCFWCGTEGCSLCT
jgi:hypothetical protein